MGALALLFSTAAPAMAETSNPNNYECLGSITAGTPEVGSEEQQVKYTFYCDGPISGYQLQAQVPVTGIAGSSLVTSIPTGAPLTDTFSCSGEDPGYALNCVGAAKAGYETITGQFAIGSSICKEPRVDPLLTVTYAYLEKTTITQAISGPYDLGRPVGCKPDEFAGSTRLDPHPPYITHKKHKKGKKGGSKKGASTKKK